MATRTRALKATWFATQIAGRISARLSEPFVSRLWFTPWPVPVGERGTAKQQQWLRPTKRVELESRFGPLAGFEAGAGPVVLLVHGWGERASFLGAFIKPLVETGYRVVGLDLPGHGDSLWRQTHPLEWVDALGDVSDQLGDLHSIVAHSMGGAVTTIAINQGLQLDKVVLIAPPSAMENVVKTFTDMFSLPHRAVLGLRRDIQRRFGSDVWDRLNIQRIAADIDVPALIVHDEDDGQVDISESRALAAAWRGSQLMLTSELGHDKIIRDPEVVDAVITWLGVAAKDTKHLAAVGASTGQARR